MSCSTRLFSSLLLGYTSTSRLGVFSKEIEKQSIASPSILNNYIIELYRATYVSPMRICHDLRNSNVHMTL